MYQQKEDGCSQRAHQICFTWHTNPNLLVFVRFSIFTLSVELIQLWWPGDGEVGGEGVPGGQRDAGKGDAGKGTESNNRMTHLSSCKEFGMARCPAQRSSESTPHK